MKISVKDNEALKKLIIMDGHTLRSFAKKIGVSSPYVVQIVNGDRNPGPQIAKKISESLNLEFEDIFFIKCGNKSNHPKKNSA